MVLQSDFQSFGPSIPHSTIAAVLEFFGFSEHWIGFFLRVLEVPVIFKDDGPHAEVRRRRRGTSMSSPLADVWGELNLFCMDILVHQRTSGSLLYRFHDDIWLWGPIESCTQGWQAMNEFATVMGLNFNTAKSGCVLVTKNQFPIPSTLPQGDVRYGFLKLGTLGYFVLDKGLADKHIEALITELALCKTLFGWIRTWNAYGVDFFTSLLGGNQLAHCFGAQHLNIMQRTFQRIHARVFPGDTIVSNHIRKQIKQRFPSFKSDVIDAFVFLPISLGGLNVQNPFVALAQLDGEMIKKPETIMDDFFKAEKEAYANAQASYKAGKIRISRENQYKPNQSFLPFPDYIKRREEVSVELLQAYNHLLQNPKPGEMQISEELEGMLGGEDAVESYSTYNLWLLELHKEELLKSFGGVHIVEKKLLPTGMIEMARKQRIKWNV